MPELNWLGDHKARRAARHLAYRLLQLQAQVGDPSAVQHRPPKSQ